MIYKAVVKSNCTDDPNFRVKVECKQLWKETSELIPSLNGMYLEEGDEVYLLQESTECYIILGKIFTDNQKQLEPIQGQTVLFRAQKSSDYITAAVIENDLTLQTSSGLELKIDLEKLTLTVPSTLKIKTDTFDIEGTTITIKGKTEFKNGFGAPDATGPLCGVPNCIFSGSPHSSSSTA